MERSEVPETKKRYTLMEWQSSLEKNTKILAFKTAKLCSAAMKHHVSMNNKLCKETVVECEYCTATFKYKIDALVHNAEKHLKISIESLQQDEIECLLKKSNLPHKKRHEKKSEKREQYINSMIKVTTEYKQYRYDDSDLPLSIISERERAMELIKNLGRSKPKVKPKPLSTIIALQPIIDLKRSSRIIPSKGSAEEETAKAELLNNFVTDCQVKVEPMIYDANTEQFIQNNVDTMPKSAIVFNGRAHFNSSMIDDSFIEQVLAERSKPTKRRQPPIIVSPPDKYYVEEGLKANAVNPSELLNSFTAECKVILGPQMIFDDDPSQNPTLDQLASAEGATDHQLSTTGHLSPTGYLSPTGHLTPTGHLSPSGHLSQTGHLSPTGHLSATGPLSPTVKVEPPEDEDESTPVNVASMTDYDSLIKPLICYCQLCPQVFPNRKELMRHQAFHVRINLYNLATDQPNDAETRKRNDEDFKSNPHPSSACIKPNFSQKYYTVQCINCPKVFTSTVSLLDHVSCHDATYSLPKEAVLNWRSKNSWIYRQCRICYEFEVKKTRLNAKQSVMKLIGNLKMTAGTTSACGTCKKQYSRLKVLRKIKKLIRKCKTDTVKALFETSTEGEQSHSVRGHTNSKIEPNNSSWVQTNADIVDENLAPNHQILEIVRSEHLQSNSETEPVNSICQSNSQTPKNHYVALVNRIQFEDDDYEIFYDYQEKIKTVPSKVTLGEVNTIPLSNASRLKNICCRFKTKK